MKNKEIEKRIYEEFQQRKPELFNKIIEQCPKMEEPQERVTFLSKLRNMIMNKRFAYSLSSVSLIIVIAFILLIQTPAQTNAYSVIAIDVNPSVVLELDEDDRIINVILNNDDAVAIVGDMDLVGVDYNVAVNALIGSMITKGYISELTNSVLLSISSGDDIKESELMDALLQEINSIFTQQAISGSIIVQNLDFEDDAEELAELLDISEAKAELILDIIEADPRMTVEELALLSINDLNLLLESKNIVLNNVGKTGNASNLSIITLEQAYQIALTELNILESDVIEFDIELEQEDGILVYEIEIETLLDTFDIMINAKDGSILTEKEDEEFPSDVLNETELLQLIALSLNLNQSMIVDFEVSEEVDNGIAFYEVSFEYNDEEFELEVDAVSGEIYYNSQDEEGFDTEDSEVDDEEPTDDSEEEEID